jgi:hypothetical protein
MRVWIALGTSGKGVHDLRDELEDLLGREVEMTETPTSTEFTFEVRTPRQAKRLIDRVLRHLERQGWYWDDDRCSYSAYGLLDDDGMEWYCDECGGDIEECECI